MVRTAFVLGVTALALTLPISGLHAQTATNPSLHARAKHHSQTAKPKQEGRQITVHKATPSWLTLGGVASPAVTSTNNYVIDTFNQPTPIEGTFAGMRGREALGRYDNPGLTLFKF